MSCIKLHKGHSLDCRNPVNRYFQQVVLINRGDLLDYNIESRVNTAGEERHRVSFALKEERTGFRFSGAPNGVVIYPNFSKETDENIPQYSHFIQLPVFGVSEENKYILKTLDYADYFAAMQLVDGTVEIYGFENGLTTGDYTYDIQTNGGGSIIELISKDMEDEPPLIYYSDDPGKDFDELFADVDLELLGDFNEDFNNDFLIGN